MVPKDGGKERREGKRWKYGRGKQDVMLEVSDDGMVTRRGRGGITEQREGRKGYSFRKGKIRTNSILLETRTWNSTNCSRRYLAITPTAERPAKLCSV